MSSPVSADTCCVCFKSIQPGDHARDSEGEWDVHKGECAEKAGVGRITIGEIREVAECAWSHGIERDGVPAGIGYHWNELDENVREASTYEMLAAFQEAKRRGWLHGVLPE